MADARAWAISLEEELRKQRKGGQARKDLPTLTIKGLIEEFLADPETKQLKYFEDLEALLGASSLMANPDSEYIVERPNQAAMTVMVSRERFKDGAALPPLAYEARVVDLGRRDAYGEAVTSLALHSSDIPRRNRRPRERISKPPWWR